MKKLILGIDRFLSVVGIALTAILATGVIISVILRYVFSIAFVQSEELLTMVFVATTFFGAALGLRESEHIAVSNFVSAMPAKPRKVFAVIGQVVIIVVSLVMIYYSYRMIMKVGKVPSPATGIPRGYYYAMIPISFLFTIFYAVVNILKEFIDIPEPVKGYKDDYELGLTNAGGGE
ncbi:MAG: TRAP-type C4-dicarboxylate transport system, small permease component [Spirochaeta sp.]|jgi:TRAP-type C4-dicarboxylate transport system permease small subunit|uniref:TRAP transporter small permease n=1 Tax=Sphaerochaeta sp. TaxID=1972642 RepID=UPI003D0D31F6|nr:TRAP-type C4-dicarboxylate transport system, small permease component [Spirochaeta sp.]